MQAQQELYLTAKVVLENALTYVQGLCPIWTGDETDDEFLAKDQAETELYERFEITAKRQALYAARRVLHAWAKSVIAEEMASHPQLETALSAFDLAKGKPQAMDKLTTMCLNLKVS